jgi:cytochrome c551/c552
MRRTLLLMLAAFTVATAKAELVKIQLPVETAVYKAGPGAQLANGQCLTCHSADYAAMQPPKPRDFWKAEVDKMREKYGAPIPSDQMEELTAYFAMHYGMSAPIGEATNAASAAAVVPRQAIDPKALALRSGCLSCHNVDVKVVGPPYKDVAAQYRGNPDGPKKIARQITQGGVGKWGQIPMPPFPKFSADEVDSLTQWILNQ